MLEAWKLGNFSESPEKSAEMFFFLFLRLTARIVKEVTLMGYTYVCGVYTFLFWKEEAGSRKEIKVFVIQYIEMKFFIFIYFRIK